MKIYLLMITSLLAMLFCSACDSNVDSNLTNPLLNLMHFRELRPFKHKIEQYLEEKKADGSIREASFYFRSLSDGMWMGINEDCRFSGASLLKIPVMMAYYKLAEKEPGVLLKKVCYEVMTNEGRYFIPGNAPVVGNYYTVDKLINLMIRFSDNNALLLLRRNMNEIYWEETLNDLGLSYSEGSTPPGDLVSIKNIVTLFRVLYNASYLNVDMSEKALKCMTGTEFKAGMASGIPPDVRLSHKFGERIFSDTGIKELHECAIVYYGHDPYLVGVMTRGEDFNRLAEVIRSISKLVYDEVDFQYNYFYPQVRPEP